MPCKITQMTKTKNIGYTLSLSRTRSNKECAFCHEDFIGIKVARYCSESCRQKAKYQRSKRQTKREIPLSRLINTRRPYDWSNPNISEEAFIISVLKGGSLEDITKTTLHFGQQKMETCLQEVDEPVAHRIAERKLKNIIKSRMINHAQT